jgi:hypothetical protein
MMQSFQFLDKAMPSYPNTRVLAPKDLRCPPLSCFMVYPDNDNDDNGGSSKKNNLKCNWVTSLRGGWRWRRRGMIYFFRRVGNVMRRPTLPAWE